MVLDTLPQVIVANPHKCDITGVKQDGLVRRGTLTKEQILDIKRKYNAQGRPNLL